MNVQAKPRHTGRFFLILFACLVIGTFLFRHDISIFGINLFVKSQTSKHFAKPLSYESIQWEQGRLVARGVHLADEHFHLSIDSVMVDWTWSWSDLYFEPHLLVLHPELTIVHHRDGGTLPVSLAPLVPKSFFGVKVDIQNGVLQLNTHDVEQRLYFTFQSREEKEHLGTFYLSYDPHLYALPTTELNFSMQKSEISASLKIGQMESARLLRLLSFFYPTLREGWENIQGSVEVMASGTFSADYSFSRLAGLIDANDLYVSNPLLGIQARAKSLHNEFIFSSEDIERDSAPFWKQVTACATIEEGEWILGEGGVTEINAHLLLAPEDDPVLDLSGKWVRGGREVPLVMQGNGSVHEDQSFWLELGVSLTPEDEAPSDALISICRPEMESYVVQTELKHLDLSLLELLGVVPAHTQGSLEGRMTGWFYDKKLGKIQVDDFKATDVRWNILEWETALSADCIEGEALFARTISGKWGVISLHGEIPEAVIERGWRSSPFAVVLSGGGRMLTFNLLRESEAIEANFDISKREGWLKSETLKAASLSPWINELIPDLSLDGEVEFFATISGEKILCSLEGSHWLMDHPRGALSIEEVTHPLLVTYSFANDTWQGVWTLQNAELTSHTRGWQIEGVCAECQWEKGVLTLSELAATSSGMGLAGSLTFDSASELLTLSTEHIEGPVESLVNLIGWKLPIRGRFVSREKGFSLVAHGEEIDWRFAAELSEMTMGIKEDLALRSGSCFIEFDSHDNAVSLSDVEAELLYRGNAYHLAGQAKRKLWWEFDAALSEGDREIAHAVGVAEIRPPSEIHIAFEKNKTHFLGTKLEISRFIIGDWKELSALEMRPVLHGEQLLEQLSYLHKAGLIPCSPPSFTLEGEIQAEISYDKRVDFTLRSPCLSIENHEFSKCYLKGFWNDEGVQIEEFAAGAFSGEALIIPDERGWQCASLGLATENSTLALHGEYIADEQLFNAQLDLLHIDLPRVALDLRGEMSYTLSEACLEGEFQLSADAKEHLFESRTPFRASYHRARGLKVEGVDLLLINAEQESGEASLFAETVTYDGKRWLGRQMRYELDLDALFPKSSKTAAWIPRSGYGDVEFLPESALLRAGFKTALHDTPLFWQLQLDQSTDELLGMIKIAEDPKYPGIKGLFKSNLQWESVIGSLYGIDLDLKKSEPNHLRGTAAIDFSKALQLLKAEDRSFIESLRLGCGYFLEGDWDLIDGRFKGELKGESFEVGGYLFEKLKADVNFNRNDCLIEGLTVADPALQLSIKQANFAAEEEWTCHVPLISVQELQPSRLHSIEGNQKTVKPFVIRKLSFFDLDGILGDLGTFTGYGNLHFTNAFKKESSLLDMPLEMIKKLGLDLNLFTPVYGEAEFRLHEGKLLVTDLANAYSEGRRSEFFLPENSGCFLDLKGNISLDLKMKQNVVMNITEPFTLSVRGTVVKPKYQLVR